MNSKLKLLKILEILMETDERHPLTALQIGEKLKLYGIEAERKSICRDINVLRDDADYDILLSADKKQGYYLASRNLLFHDKSDNVMTKIHIDEILKAIKAERKISFQYTYTTVNLEKELRRDGHCYVVNPYRLVWKNEHYYLIGNYDKYD